MHDPTWIPTLLLILWVILLCGLLLLGLFLNFLGLAGNWLILGSMIVHRLLTQATDRIGISWTLLGLLAVLAVLGEGLEALAGLLGAGKAGSSRRAIVLSLLGAMMGAGFGFGLGNAAVPILGGIAGVFLLGALGALAGAVLGETWKGKTLEESLETGKGAFIGRLLGTLSKTLICTAMLVVSLGALVF